MCLFSDYFRYKIQIYSFLINIHKIPAKNAVFKKKDIRLPNRQTIPHIQKG